MRVSRQSSLTNLILLSLEKSVDGYGVLEDFMYNPPNVMHGGFDRSVKKSSLAVALHRLRQKGLVDFIDTNKLVYRLTNSGIEEASIAKMNLGNQVWDGKWRLISFDIPESKRVVRDLLRYRLKQWGFEPKQKSLWITKKDCKIPLKNFIKKVGIESWVIVWEATEV